MKATIVFEKNWSAINAKTESGEQKYKYIINRGSSRSSKTVSLMQVYTLYAKSNKSKRLTIWRDTKTDCRKTVLADYLKYLKSNGLYKTDHEFNKTEAIFTYTTDSTIEIHGTDDEETVHGLEQDCAWFNEPYKISRDTFDQIDQRTSDFVFIDYNPKKDHWVEDLMKDPRSIIIDSTFKDNPFCPKEQRTKILSYQPISMCDVVLNKNIDINESQAIKYNLEDNPLTFTTKQINELLRCRFNEEKKTANKFKWEVYGLGHKAEKPNRIFNWRIVSQNEYESLDAKIYIGVDWGKVDPWGIIECKYYDGKLYVKELNYLSENQWREKMNSTDRLTIDSDTSEEGIEGGIVLWLFKKLGIKKKYDIICDSNRLTKIAVLRRKGYEYAIPAKTKETGKSSILDGIELLSLLDVCIVDGSTNLINENESYSYKVDRYGVVLEEPEDQDNHLHDPTRYVAQYLRKLGVIKTI